MKPSTQNVLLGTTERLDKEALKIIALTLPEEDGVRTQDVTHGQCFHLCCAELLSTLNRFTEKSGRKYYNWYHTMLLSSKTENADLQEIVQITTPLRFSIVTVLCQANVTIQCQATVFPACVLVPSFLQAFLNLQSSP